MLQNNAHSMVCFTLNMYVVICVCKCTEKHVHKLTDSELPPGREVEELKGTNILLCIFPCFVYSCLHVECIKNLLTCITV